MITLEKIRTFAVIFMMTIQTVTMAHLLGGNIMEILGALVLAGTIIFIVMIVANVPTKVVKKKKKAVAKRKKK